MPKDDDQPRTSRADHSRVTGDDHADPTDERQPRPADQEQSRLAPDAELSGSAPIDALTRSAADDASSRSAVVDELSGSAAADDVSSRSAADDALTRSAADEESAGSTADQGPNPSHSSGATAPEAPRNDRPTPVAQQSRAQTETAQARKLDREGDGIDARDLVDEVRDDVRLSAWPVIAVLAVLVAVNLLTNRVAPELYLLWAWTGAAVLLAIALRDGETWTSLGMGRIPRKAWWGSAGVIGLILVIYLGAAILPATREAFGDDRVADLSAADIVVRALIRVPLGTVLLEEVAFRAVLLAMLWRRLGVLRGIVISSLVFGLWHILPSLGITQANEALGAAVGGGTSGQVLGVVFAVVSTTVAGVVFCELRRRFEHVVVPMALHWATNGLGYLFAWAIVTGRVL